MAVLKQLTTCSVLLLSSSIVFADEAVEQDNAPDPGDHTKVSTLVTATYGVQSLGEQDNNMVQLVGQMSGAKQNGHLFLGQLTLQGQENANTFPADDSFDLSQVRARYFEVTRTEWEHAPMLGVSLDYIETSFVDGALNDRLFALGGLIRMNTPFENWLSFPIVAAAYGQNSDFAKDVLGAKSSAYGVQFNYLNSIYLHENGTHLQVNPQYSMIDFGGAVGTVNSLQLDLAIQAPISKNRKHWGKLTYTEYFDDAGQSFGHNDQNTELKFTYSYYL